MGTVQANAFLRDFRVIDYFSDGVGADSIGVTGLGQGTGLPSFASATVFERVSNGERILAIRGTNNLLDWPTDVVSLFTFGSPKYQFQYSILKEKVIDWISRGVLRPGFTVTGHSLGGFLAAALTADAGPEISHTYLFNAPGFDGFQIPGMARSPNEWLSRLHAGIPGINESKITNVTAEGGVSLISGLGIPVGDRVYIAVETALQSSMNVVQLYTSHKIEMLTDALAVYDLLARIDSQVSLDTSGAILQAAAPDNHESLERVLNVLALPLSIPPIPSGDVPRDQLFDKIDQVSRAVTTSGPYHIISLIDKTTGHVVNLARDDISVRYALTQLDPFALSGRDELFAPFNQSGQLDFAREDGTGGPLTRQWLADRAELVSALGWANTYELGNTIQSDTRPARDFVFITGDGNSETLHVVRTQAGSNASNVEQVVFGTEQTDILGGRDAADHLYGGFGDDRISGGKGSDYLEGGPGGDTLTGDAGNDRLVGGAGDDTLDGGADADLLEGGAGFDTYVLHRNDGGDAIVDSDGRGRIELDGVVLTGGTIERPGSQLSEDGRVHYTFAGDLASSGTLVIDGKTEVHHFRNGDLGIHLVAGDAPLPPHAGGSLIYVDNPYDLASLARNDPIESLHPWGSPGEDTYIAGPNIGANFIGLGGNDHLIGGGTMRAYFLGGAGDDWIENREITYTADTVSTDPHLLAGQAGRDFISGSVNDELLFGDFYQFLTSSSASVLHAFIDNFELYDYPAGHSVYPDGLAVASYFPPIGSREMYFNPGFYYNGSALRALESFIGYSADTLPDDAYDDVVDGGGGDDIVVGGPGSDTLFGGPGDDRLYGDDAFNARPRIPFHTLRIDAPAFEPYLALFGQPGDDYIEGGDGDDEISDRAGTGSVVSGGDGDDSITVSMGSDETPDIATYAIVDGGDGDDIIDASARDVDIDAGRGDDDIEGNGQGTLVIDAGPGNDRISGFGVFAFVDGGAGADTYRVNGLDVTIRDDDPDTGNIDTLELQGTPQDFQFSRDGDDLLIGYWLSVSVSEEGYQLIEGAMSIEDWFAGASHQIEEIVFTPDSGEETVWAPDDIAAALDAGGLAWSDFIEPDVPEFQPVALSALPPATVPPPAPTDPPRASPDPAPTYPPPALPDPAPAAEYDEPVIAPAPNPNVTRLPHVSQVPVHIEITDPGFNGSLRGTASADVFTVLSERGVVIDAGDGDDQITTGGGSDEVRPGPGNDVVSTGGGDDRVIIDRFEGDKRIDAGPGIDILSIDRSISSISGHMEDGRIVIRDAKDGSLAVTNVNIFELADTVFVLANGESEAIAARLYTMALGRTPDAPGVRYWLDEIAAGRPLADVVHIFSSALYTGTQDEQFLEGFYARAFHRAPDPAEESFWLGQLQTGAVTRDQMITGLAASEEAQLTITGVIPLPGSL